MRSSTAASMLSVFLACCVHRAYFRPGSSTARPLRRPPTPAQRGHRPHLPRLPHRWPARRRLRPPPFPRGSRSRAPATPARRSSSATARTSSPTPPAPPPAGLPLRRRHLVRLVRRREPPRPRAAGRGMDSGADSWTTSRRQSFAWDDLTRPQLPGGHRQRQPEGDQDPATWMPSRTATRRRGPGCRRSTTTTSRSTRRRSSALQGLPRAAPTPRPPSVRRGTSRRLSLFRTGRATRGSSWRNCAWDHAGARFPRDRLGGDGHGPGRGALRRLGARGTARNFPHPAGHHHAWSRSAAISRMSSARPPVRSSRPGPPGPVPGAAAPSAPAGSAS
ncbi:hypothetical protein SMICM17S_01404 [Streptomyces microflavus]